MSTSNLTSTGLAATAPGFFPYGAQYYRAANPPAEDWEADLRQMKAQGMNTVRLWALWSWIHRDDNQFDFSELDKLMQLCQQLGLRVLMQVILENAPAWLVARLPEALHQANDGRVIRPMGRPNTPGGGWPGLCLHSRPAQEAAASFMTALAQRYRGHPALLGYDAWNEVWYELDGYIGSELTYCYCDASISAFHRYLRRTYAELADLNEVWRRRYTAWSQVEPPRYWGGYPDWLDWLQFRLQAQGQLLRWRVATLRAADPTALLVSHGLPTTLGSMANQLTDDWRNAAEVDSYGLSFFPFWFNYDDAECFRVHDMVRCASRGKTFWTAETQGGQAGEGLTQSRKPDAADIRLWNWMSLACGGRGMLYWQWRPELLGPEAPGFGLCSLDGTPTERTEVAAWFAHFTSSQPELTAFAPLKGEIAIAALPESQLFCHIADRNAGKYAQSVRGAYTALSQAGLQVDFASLDQLRDYPVVFLPFPLMLSAASAAALADFVREGGQLISAACPGLFGAHGHTQVDNPGYGLADVFGVTAMEGPETIVEPAPAFTWQETTLTAVIHRQLIQPTTATVLATYSDGWAALTSHAYGNGRAWLVTTYPGIAAAWGQTAATTFLVQLIRHCGSRARVQSQPAGLWCRLHKHSETAEHLLYVVNPMHQSCTATVQLTLPQLAGCGARDLVSGAPVTVQPDGQLELEVAGKDSRVIRLHCEKVTE